MGKHMPDFNSMPEINVCLLLFSALVGLFLLIGAIAARTRSHPFMKKFIKLLIADIIMQLGEAGIWFFQGSTEKIPLLKLCCVLSFGLGFVVIALFISCLMEFFRERESSVSMLPARIMYAICGGMFFLVILSAFNGMFFTFDEQGMMIDGFLWFVICIFDILSFIAVICIIIYHRGFLSVMELLSLLSFSVLPLTSAMLVNIWYPTPEYLATTLSLIVVFIMFYGEITRQLEEKKKELAQSRMEIMVSQIQPHFLYNSLNTIYHLCSKDVKMAQRAINDFSEYLRRSLNSINRTNLIPFNEELKHVKAYLQLEQIRFSEKLSVVYSIETEAFLLPALSIQPLIENAVKHGICPQEEGGTVTLSVREHAECFEVKVSDDGAGFNMEEMQEDGKLHIGIENVRQRLAAMCNGELIIDSIPGKGTTASVRIPKEDVDENYRS